MWTQQLFWVLVVLLLVQNEVLGAIVQEDGRVDGSSGRLRYFYDDQMPNACDNVVVMGVGTSMRTSDYDELSMELVSSTPLVVLVVDQNPFWFVKTSHTRFARFTNTMMEQLGDIVPVCQAAAVKRLVVGGHSAGGQAAWNAIPLLEYAPSGFIGLDPFRLDPSSDNIDIPALFWGFTETTCSVTVEQAAKAGYQAANKGQRVLYQFQNAGSGAGHCSFTDGGCAGAICPAREEPSTWVRESVAFGTKRFLQVIATESGTWNKETFELEESNVGKANLFINQDTPQRRRARTRYLRGRQ